MFLETSKIFVLFRMISDSSFRICVGPTYTCTKKYISVFESKTAFTILYFWKVTLRVDNIRRRVRTFMCEPHCVDEHTLFRQRYEVKSLPVTKDHAVVNLDTVYASGHLHAPTVLLPSQRGRDAIRGNTSLQELQVQRSQLVRVSRRDIKAESVLFLLISFS